MKSLWLGLILTVTMCVILLCNHGLCVDNLYLYGKVLSKEKSTVTVKILDTCKGTYKFKIKESKNKKDKYKTGHIHIFFDRQKYVP